MLCMFGSDPAQNCKYDTCIIELARRVIAASYLQVNTLLTRESGGAWVYSRLCSITWTR